MIYESPKELTLARLWKGIEEGLILPLDENYKLLSSLSDSHFSFLTLKSSFRFLHDRVQQAAYQQIPEEDRKALHWKIGQLILRNIPPEKQEERIFDIVSHLNLGFGELCRVGANMICSSERSL